MYTYVRMRFIREVVQIILNPDNVRDSVEMQRLSETRNNLHLTQICCGDANGIRRYKEVYGRRDGRIRTETGSDWKDLWLRV